MEFNCFHIVVLEHKVKKPQEFCQFNLHRTSFLNAGAKSFLYYYAKNYMLNLDSIQFIKFFQIDCDMSFFHVTTSAY